MECPADLKRIFIIKENTTFDSGFVYIFHKIWIFRTVSFKNERAISKKKAQNIQTSLKWK